MYSDDGQHLGSPTLHVAMPYEIISVRDMGSAKLCGLFTLKIFPPSRVRPSEMAWNKLFGAWYPSFAHFANKTRHHSYMMNSPWHKGTSCYLPLPWQFCRWSTDALFPDICQHCCTVNSIFFASTHATDKLCCRLHIVIIPTPVWQLFRELTWQSAPIKDDEDSHNAWLHVTFHECKWLLSLTTKARLV